MSDYTLQTVRLSALQLAFALRLPVDAFDFADAIAAWLEGGSKPDLKALQAASAELVAADAARQAAQAVADAAVEGEAAPAATNTAAEASSAVEGVSDGSIATTEPTENPDLGNVDPAIATETPVEPVNPEVTEPTPAQ